MGKDIEKYLHRRVKRIFRLINMPTSALVGVGYNTQ